MRKAHALHRIVLSSFYRHETEGRFHSKELTEERSMQDHARPNALNALLHKNMLLSYTYINIYKWYCMIADTRYNIDSSSFCRIDFLQIVPLQCHALRPHTARRGWSYMRIYTYWNDNWYNIQYWASWKHFARKLITSWDRRARVPSCVSVDSKCMNKSYVWTSLIIMGMVGWSCDPTMFVMSVYTL